MERKLLKKVLAVLLTASMSFGFASGCSGKQEGSSGTKAVSESQASEQKVKLKYAISAKNASETGQKNMIAEINKQAKGFEIEEDVIPGEVADFDQKVMVSLMAGDEMDFLYTNDNTVAKYAKADVILPLDDLAKAHSFNINSNFGDTIRKINGKTYMLPCTRDVHITFYNKSLFDKAHVPYPDNSTWTWDKYVEDAKKITNAKEEIYGSYMLDWDTYFTFSAKQKGVSAYKADGTSNFDDPAWSESMKFFADLGNVLKVQPDIVTYETKKLQWDGFMTGKYGMFVCGSWALSMLSDQKTYPRKWKAGIAVMPMVESGKESSLSIMGGYSICSTTKHKDEAYKAVQMLALNEWKIPNTGRVPDLVNLSDKEKLSAMKSLSESLSFDGITTRQLENCILSPKINLVCEKVVGNGMTTINDLIPKEGQLYASGQRTLAQTMKEIKTKSDKAISDDKNK